MGVTEQPGAGEEAEGKRNVKDGCCRFSRAGAGEGRGTGLARVRPRSRVRPGRSSPSQKCERRVGWRGQRARRGPDPGRRGGCGMRPAPSLPRPLRCVEAARAHLGVLGYCPILRPPSSGPGRTGRRLQARAAAAAAPPLGSRRRSGAGPGARHCGKGVGRGREGPWDGGRRGGTDGRTGLG